MFFIRKNSVYCRLNKNLTLMTDLVVWTSKYSVGCDYIDEQHKKLIQIINELYSNFMERSSRDKMQKILDELVDYTVYHFNAEEKMLEEHGAGPSEEHKKQHQDFVNKIKVFQKRYELGDNVLGLDIMNFLKDWLLNHILGTDMKYSKEVCPKVD